MMSNSNSHITRSDYFFFLSTNKHEQYLYGYFYLLFMINKCLEERCKYKQLSLMIYAGYEGSDHYRINLPVLFIFLAMLLPSYPHAKKAFYLARNNEANI